MTEQRQTNTDHRGLVSVATGILMQRYRVSAVTAESALMDWSRVTQLDVPDLAARLIADSQREGKGTP